MHVYTYEPYKHVCTYTYTFIHVNTHVHINVNMPIQICIHTCANVPIGTYICLYVNTLI